MATASKPQSHKIIKTAFYVVCSALLIVLVVQQHTTFWNSLLAIRHISPLWLLAGFAVLLTSVLASSAVYRALSPLTLKFWRTAVVLTGSLGVNRLLPAGSGALGIAYLYLRANKVGRAQAGAIVAANNILGFMGHAILLAAALLAYPHVFEHFHDLSAGKFIPWLVAAAILSIIAVFVAVMVKKTTLGWAKALQPLLQHPGRLWLALLFSMAITVCYATALLLACSAMGYHLSPAAGLIILSFGVAAASAVPVPGGVGAAEAGVFTGMHAYGATNQNALAVALLYRLMTFWLPLIVGGLVFIFVDKRGYLSPNSKVTAKRSES